jgi:hypothetical protein
MGERAGEAKARRQNDSSFHVARNDNYKPTPSLPSSGSDSLAFPTPKFFLSKRTSFTYSGSPGGLASTTLLEHNILLITT